jgi:8-oxo-dGTP pyrophosphatase MutT (NUDIX family)
MLVQNERTRVFLTRDDKSFLVMIGNFKNKVGKDWCVLLLPGGGIDDGETPEQGLRREVQEELGVELVGLIEIMEYRKTRKADALEQAYFPKITQIENHYWFYKADIARGKQPRILEPHKFDAITWVSASGIEDLAKHYNALIGDGIVEAASRLSTNNLHKPLKASLEKWQQW